MSLLILDYVGTLAAFKTNTLLPHVAERLAEARAEYDHVAIASNQGGVGLRHWMASGGFGTPTDYPTQQDVLDQIQATIDATVLKDWSPLVLCSFAYQSQKGNWSPVPSEAERSDNGYWTSHDPAWRKPNPGMILRVCDVIDPDRITLVGDHLKDYEAVQNVKRLDRGVPIEFVWSYAFFDREPNNSETGAMIELSVVDAEEPF